MLNEAPSIFDFDFHSLLIRLEGTFWCVDWIAHFSPSGPVSYVSVEQLTMFEEQDKK